MDAADRCTLDGALSSGASTIELVPADLAGLGRVAELLRAHAAVLDDASGALGRVEVTGWWGPAGGAFHERLGEQPGYWSAAASGVAAGATALETYAASVPAARSLADEARRLWAAAVAEQERAAVAAQFGGIVAPPGLSLGSPAVGPPSTCGSAPDTTPLDSTAPDSTARDDTAPGDALRRQEVETLARARAAVAAAADEARRALVDASQAAPQARRFDEVTIRPAGAAGAAHLGLDALGMVPVVGALADLTNAAWYAADGDDVGAALSAGSAVPGLGDALGAGVILGRVSARSLDRASALWSAVPEVALGRGALSVLRAARDAPGRLLTHVPYGFADHAAYDAFSAQLERGLADAGIADGRAYLRGSSVGGVRYRTGESVAETGPGDVDVAVVSPQLLDRLREHGVGLRGGGTRTGVLSPQTLDQLGLQGLTSALGSQYGRPVSIMVYGSQDAVLLRGDAILVR